MYFLIYSRLVTSVEQCHILVLGPFGLCELLEMGFKFPFNLMGKLTVVLLRGQSWHILKSWCKFRDPGKGFLFHRWTIM